MDVAYVYSHSLNDCAVFLVPLFRAECDFSTARCFGIRSGVVSRKQGQAFSGI
jgi:hypothetical protein